MRTCTPCASGAGCAGLPDTVAATVKAHCTVEAMLAEPTAASQMVQPAVAAAGHAAASAVPAMYSTRRRPMKPPVVDVFHVLAFGPGVGTVALAYRSRAPMENSAAMTTSDAAA